MNLRVKADEAVEDDFQNALQVRPCKLDVGFVPPTVLKIISNYFICKIMRGSS